MTPFELPSLEEIQEMDKHRSQAKESLEISDSDNSVKCQGCGVAVPTGYRRICCYLSGES
jgi:hypothetical protein